jgi:uncharacterized protein YjgD (DUF1641 family)
MSKPIPIDLPKRNLEKELSARLERAPAAHAEALLAGMDLLQALHHRGGLQLLQGIVEGGDKTLEIAVDALNTPEAIRGVRNLLIMVKMMGSIEPELMERLAADAPGMLATVARAQQAEPPGWLGVWKILRGKGLRRGLATVNRLFDGR